MSLMVLFDNAGHRCISTKMSPSNNQQKAPCIFEFCFLNWATTGQTRTVHSKHSGVTVIR